MYRGFIPLIVGEPFTHGSIGPRRYEALWAGERTLRFGSDDGLEPVHRVRRVFCALGETEHIQANPEYVRGSWEVESAEVSGISLLCSDELPGPAVAHDAHRRFPFGNTRHCLIPRQGSVIRVNMVQKFVEVFQRIDELGVAGIGDLSVDEVFVEIDPLGSRERPEDIRQRPCVLISQGDGIHPSSLQGVTRRPELVPARGFGKTVLLEELCVVENDACLLHT